jgi:hypothetical protein
MKPFLHGKKALPTEALRPPLQFAAALLPGCKAPGHAGMTPATGESTAHVEVVKEGDKVVRLIVNCRCGEKIEIECLYTAGR